MAEYVKNKLQRVIIVGAGLTGLSTAMNLLEGAAETELSITVIEARGRVGGRTHTEIASCEELKGATVDVGGQWVGPTQTRVLKLLDQFGLQLKEQLYPPQETTDRLEVECIGYENPPLSIEAAEELKSFMSVLDGLIEEVDVEAPWSHPHATNYDNMSVNDFVFSQIDSQEARKEALLLILSLTGVEGHLVSFLFCLFFIKTGGGMESLGDGEQGSQKWYIRGGSQQISKHLVALLEERGVEFRMQDPVVKVLETQEKTFWITTKGEDTLHADHLVLAMCPALAIKKIEFSPPLPETQTQLYSSIEGGSAAKVIVVFKEPFWLKPQEEPGLAGHFADTGPIQNMFHTEIGDYPGLVCLCVGDPATQLYNASPEERKRIVLEQIRTLYFPKSSTKGDVSANEDLLGVVFFIDKIWANEEFSSGCYCGMWLPNGTFSSLGPMYLSQKGGNPGSAQEPLRNIHFASTETSDTFVGYMEGAIRAGEMVAAAMLKQLKTSP